MAAPTGGALSPGNVVGGARGGSGWTRVVWPMAIALGALLVGSGCRGGASEPHVAETVAFLENQSAFSGFVGGQFSMNLLFRTPEGTTAPDVSAVRLLPAVPWLEIGDVSVTENSAHGDIRRWALGLTARGTGAGSAEFRDIELDTPAGPIRAAVGTIRVDIVAGEPAGLFALFTSGGVHPEPLPFEFTVENTTAAPAVLRDILLDHPLIRYEKADIAVAGAPLGAEGFRLDPGAKVDVAVNWSVQSVEAPVNLEARPLLVVGQAGEIRYTGLHNLVVRKDPALTG